MAPPEMLLDRVLRNLTVSVEPFAICEIGDGWRLSLPGPADTMLHFVLRGHGAIEAPDGTRSPLAGASVAIVPAGMIHSLQAGDTVHSELRINAPPSTAPVHRIVAGPAVEPALLVACGIVHVQFEQFLGVFDHLDRIIVADLSDVRQVTASVEEILSEQSLSAPASDSMTGALMTQCLIHIFRRLVEGDENGLLWLMPLLDRRLARVIDLILKNPGIAHSVDSLAEAACMSRSTFAQHFVSVLGRSPMNFVHQVRMERAVDLLQNGIIPIDKVVCCVGFSSRSHFSRAFKKHTGIPPGAFLRSARHWRTGARGRDVRA